MRVVPATVRELIDAEVWERVCALYKLDATLPYRGLLPYDHVFLLPHQLGMEIGILEDTEKEVPTYGPDDLFYDPSES